MPAKIQARQPEAFSAFVLAYWRGEMPLWSAFWVYGMFVGTLLGLVMSHVSAVVFNQVQLATMVDDPVVWLFFGYVAAVMMAFWLCYYTWHVVSVWRCARRHDGVATLWGWAARLFVLAVTFTYWPAFVYVTAAGL